MNIEEFRDFCLLLPDTSESMPFGDDTLVMKVKDKVFALASLNRFSMNLKCDPDKAVELREKYVDIIPGFHMNKKHWNSIYPNATVSDKLIRELIVHSFEMVVQKMPLKDRGSLLEALKEQHPLEA